jgi:hypothetical protein
LDIWELMRQYEGIGVVIKYNTIKNYIDLKLKNTDKLSNFIQKFRNNISKLEQIGISLPKN